MKALKFTAVALLSLLTLSACGGSGGSKPTPTPKTVGTVPSQPTTPATNPNTPTPTKEYPIQGHYLIGADLNQVGYVITTLRGENLNILSSLNSIPLADPGSNPVDGYYRIGSGAVNDNSLLQNVRFGIVGSDQIYIFSQGVKAENIPTTGKATYKGESVFVFVDQEDPQKALGYYKGLPATFDVDFDQKSLIGSIQVYEDSPNLVFNATIRENKFSHYGGIDGISVEGAFYGKDASELGGTYLKRDAFSGSFGAKKVE